MKAILWEISLILLASFANATVKNHSCIPTGYSAICTLEFVFYNRSRTETHVFPTNYSHIRIGSDGWSPGVHSVIKEFSPFLYAELGHPQAIEIVNAYMETLEIPAKLQYGKFADNYLGWFSVEPTENGPLLTFLDLGSNRLNNITNISSLINLAALNLQRNRIAVLELNLLKSLTKLKHLNLHNNIIHHMSGERFPASLTYLGLYNNDLKALNYSDLSLPALETLNIERNHLKTFDASAMILAMPKIKSIRLGGNDFSFDKLKPALDILDRHNITYKDEADEISCYYDAQKVEGVCISRRSGSANWLVASGLTVLTVLVAIVFVLIVRWVFIAMNK